MFQDRHQSRRRNPVATFVAGFGALVVGPVDLILLRFAWATLNSGKVSNALAAQASQLGFVLPTHRMWDWNRVYLSRTQCCDEPQQHVLRAGMGVVLAVQGDFYTQFSQGSIAGNAVWVNPIDGSAAASDEGGFVKSYFTCMENTQCGEWARISSWPKIFSH